MTITTTAGVHAPAIPDDLDALSDAELAERTLFAYWATTVVRRWSGRPEDLPRMVAVEAAADARFQRCYRAWLERRGVTPRAGVV